MSRLDFLSGRLETTRDRLESLLDMPTTSRRTQRIQRLQRRIDRLENKIEAIAPFEPQFETVDINGDTVEISFKAADESWDWDRFEVQIHDSASDDSYSANDTLLMQVEGTRSVGNGRTETISRTKSLASGDYWEDGDELTLLTGANLRRFEDFDEFTVTVAVDDGDRSFGYGSDEILAVQTFNSSDVFL